MGVLLHLCLFKLVYWGLLLAAVCAAGSYEFFDTLKWPTKRPATFESHFLPFDGAYYASISEAGYRPGEQANAFYPLWPFTIRLASAGGATNRCVVALLLANLFSLGAWALFYSCVMTRYGARVAKWSLLWLLLFPGSLFYQLAYSESLFFLLLVALWYALETNGRTLICVLGFLLPLTRAVGIFCIIPMAWYVVRSNLSRKAGERASESGALANAVALFYRATRRETGSFCANGIGRSSEWPDWRSTPMVWWVLLFPFFGWGCYFLVMFAYTGNPFEGFAAQSFWGVHAINHIWDIPRFVQELFLPTNWHGFTGSLLDRTVFMLLVCLLPIMWRLDKSLIIWTLAIGVLPAMSGTFTSFVRFASVVFPLFIALAVFFERNERRWLRYGLLICFACIQVALIWRYSNFQWAG
ncbi:MAG: mannosyltransferase family protein [Verrucomicrobiota bacterium]